MKMSLVIMVIQFPPEFLPAPATCRTRGDLSSAFEKSPGLLRRDPMRPSRPGAHLLLLPLVLALLAPTAHASGPPLQYVGSLNPYPERAGTTYSTVAVDTDRGAGGRHAGLRSRVGALSCQHLRAVARPPPTSMKRLTTAPNLALATLWADLLSNAGVPTTVQRQYASSIAGEVPPDQTLPELWVQDDEQLGYPEAGKHGVSFGRFWSESYHRTRSDAAGRCTGRWRRAWCPPSS